MKIKEGGQTERLKGNITEIRVQNNYSSPRSIELWINDDSLSYLTIEELLDLKDEITNALTKIIKQ